MTQPVEPTAAMIEAGAAVLSAFERSEDSPVAAARDCWLAMQAAQERDSRADSE